MNRARRYGIRGLLIVSASVAALTVPAAGYAALAVAVAVLVHDGSSAASARWAAAWLVLLELAGGSPVGTLALPYCASALAFAGAQRSLSLAPWGERGGWAFTDAVRSVLAALALGMLAGALWAVAGTLAGAPDTVLRIRAAAGQLPALAVILTAGVLLVRFSTEPLRRPIIFASS